MLRCSSLFRSEPTSSEGTLTLQIAKALVTEVNLSELGLRGELGEDISVLTMVDGHIIARRLALAAAQAFF